MNKHIKYVCKKSTYNQGILRLVNECPICNEKFENNHVCSKRERSRFCDLHLNKPIKVTNNHEVGNMHLECQLCQNILWKPYNCSACKTLFCRACLAQRQSDQCATCLVKTKFIKAPRSVNNLLTRYIIECPKCREIFQYELFYKHLLRCSGCLDCKYKC